MNKRRAHRKSRAGCSECKRRHVKCDEEKPQCLRCLRHNIPCTYLQLSKAVGGSSSPEDYSPQSESSWQFIGKDDCTQPSPNIASAMEEPKDLFAMSDMALLHHWTTVAGYSLVNAHETVHSWISVIPLIGFKYPYVIHSILSLSALHMAYTSRPDRGSFLLIATQHRSKALDGFSQDLHNMGVDNSNALFANATLTFLFAIISFSNTFNEDDNTKDQTARILGADWIPLVRGTATVLHPIYDHVREGPLGPLVDLKNFENLDPTEDLHASAFSDQLFQLQELWVGDEHADVYNETLRILRKCNAWMAQIDNLQEDFTAFWDYNRSFSGPFIWLFATPEKYFVLQQQRQPCALIVFAYFGVMLDRLNDHWWVEGCGKSIVTAVDECLGPYWSLWMDWAKQAVRIH